MGLLCCEGVTCRCGGCLPVNVLSVRLSVMKDLIERLMHCIVTLIH